MIVCIPSRVKSFWIKQYTVMGGEEVSGGVCFGSVAAGGRTVDKSELYEGLSSVSGH